MSEPYLPQPPPEESYWDPHPPRCPECGEIIDPRPVDGEWQGWCQTHGMVEPVYLDSWDSENADEEEE